MMEKKSHGAPEEQRLVPRFPLPKEQVKFFFESFDDLESEPDIGGKVFAVRDISSNGIGIGLSEVGEALLFPISSFCRAELKLAGSMLSVRLKVARINAWSIGFVFVDLPKEAEIIITDFIHPLRVAKSMKKVLDPLAPAPFATGISSWYHGESATDLYFWSNARGGVERVLLCMGNTFWEWNNQQDPDFKIRTGQMNFLDADKAELHFDENLSEEVQSTALKILEHIDAMDYRLVNFLKDQALENNNG